MSRSTAFAALLSITLLCVTAFATTTDEEEVTCPICEHEFEVLVVMSTNSFGGPDLDLCSHAAGEDVRTLAVWTCPSCRYSRGGEEFAEAVEPPIADRIRKELQWPVEVGKIRTQRDIPAWVKYHLAGLIMEWEDADPLVLANYYIEAAWATRCEGWSAVRPLRGTPLDGRLTELDKEVREYANDHPVTTGHSAFRRSLAENAAAKHLYSVTMKSKLSPEERALRLLTAALWFRHRGENQEAAPIAREVGEAEEAPERLALCAHRILASIEREQVFQRKWLAAFERAIEQSGVEGEDLAVLQFIAGETFRRLGLKEEALQRFLLALEAEDAPAWLGALSQAALERTGGDLPDDEKLEEFRRRRLARLIAKLNDPETSDRAMRELAGLGDREAIPHLVTALAHDHPEVRANAALTLRFLPEPGAAATEALTRVLLHDSDELPRAKAAWALVHIGDPRSRPALEAALTKETDEGIEEDLIEALGIVGEAGSLSAILSAYYSHGREVELTLTRLLNREVPKDTEHREELREWIGKNRPGDRRDWVRQGFTEAGIEIGDPWSRDCVPRLIELLSDQRHWIRVNAHRVLREISGRLLPWREIADPFDSPRAKMERKEAIVLWKEWWAEKKGK